MEVSQEQIEQLKKQVLEQIDSTFPEDKKQEAKERIFSMNKEEFIEFLKQNKLVQDPNSPNPEATSSGPQETPFRQIIQGNIPSHKIDENKECIAVLEINPISPGHSIIIPKEAVHEVSKIPQTCLFLAKKIAKKIKTKFKPKDVLVSSSSVLGEIIINILPQYENETLESQRSQAKEEELQKLQKLLEKKSRAKNTVPKVKKEKLNSSQSNKTILPRRIP